MAVFPNVGEVGFQAGAIGSPFLSHHLLCFRMPVGGPIECWGQDKDTGATVAINTKALPWDPAVGLGSTPGEGLRERAVLMHSDSTGTAKGPVLAWLEPAQSVIGLWDIVNNSFTTVPIHLNAWVITDTLQNNSICANFGDGFIYQVVINNTDTEWGIRRFKGDGTADVDLHIEVSSSDFLWLFSTSNIWIQKNSTTAHKYTYAGVFVETVNFDVGGGPAILRCHYSISPNIGGGFDIGVKAGRRAVVNGTVSIDTSQIVGATAGEPCGGPNVIRNALGMFPWTTNTLLQWVDILNTNVPGGTQTTITMHSGNLPELVFPHNVSGIF